MPAKIAKANGRERQGRFIDGVLCFKCTGCRRWKWKSAFAPLKSRSSKCGIVSQCRPCARAVNRTKKQAARTNGALLVRRAAEERDARRREQSFREKMIARGLMQPPPVLIEKHLEAYSPGPYGVHP